MEFKVQNRGKVWEGADQSGVFTPQEVQTIKTQWQNYYNGLNFDMEMEYELIEQHCMNNSATISPYWKEYAARDNVDTTVQFNTSSTLKVQRAYAKDRKYKLNDKDLDQKFPGALMCCDDPSSTTAFLVRAFSDHHGIGLDERLELLPKVAKFVQLHMNIAFICKWHTMVMRPSDYEMEMGKDENRPSVSAIPHPNHPSMPSGHSTVGQAVKKYIVDMYGDKVGNDWKALCDEVGTARITCGIHWFADHQAAVDNMNTFDQLVRSKM